MFYHPSMLLSKPSMILALSILTLTHTSCGMMKKKDKNKNQPISLLEEMNAPRIGDPDILTIDEIKDANYGVKEIFCVNQDSALGINTGFKDIMTHIGKISDDSFQHSQIEWGSNSPGSLEFTMKNNIYIPSIISIKDGKSRFLEKQNYGNHVKSNGERIRYTDNFFVRSPNFVKFFEEGSIENKVYSGKSKNLKLYEDEEYSYVILKRHSEDSFSAFVHIDHPTTKRIIRITYIKADITLEEPKKEPVLSKEDLEDIEVLKNYQGKKLYINRSYKKSDMQINDTAAEGEYQLSFSNGNEKSNFLYTSCKISVDTKSLPPEELAKSDYSILQADSTGYDFTLKKEEGAAFTLTVQHPIIKTIFCTRSIRTIFNVDLPAIKLEETNELIREFGEIK